MKQDSKDDIKYVLLSGLIVAIFLAMGFVWLTAFNNMSEKEKEDIIILQMMGQQQ